FCKLHQPMSFSISFGVGHSKPPVLPAFRIPALLVTYYYNRAAIYRRKPSDNGFIIALIAVPVNLDKIFSYTVDVVQRIRAFGMAGKLDTLPAGQILENGLAQLIHPFFQ